MADHDTQVASSRLKQYFSANNLVLLLLSLILATAGTAQTIQSGARWADNSGNFIKAHGGGITVVGGTYYWLGEADTAGGDFAGINCYSSNDLVNWTFVNDVLPPQTSGDLAAGSLVERPHVLYNSSTGQYVMWLHIWSGDAVGYATSNSVCGNYTYLGSSQPLGNESFDIGSFQDTDGSAYLLSANYNHGLIVYKMSSDYLSPVSIVDGNSTWGNREAPAMFKVNGTYFLICSYESGWSANDNQYSSAPSIGGPWTPLQNIAPSGTNTYTSQSTFVLPVSGTAGTTYIYMGDRWLRGTIDQSPYVWLPLSVSGTTLSLPWVNNWAINIGAGTWTSEAFGYLHMGSSHSFVNMNSGLCLDSGNTSQGTVATGVYCGTDNYQQWNITYSSNNYYITGLANGLLLEDESNSTATGSPVDSWPNNGGSNQAWLFTNVGQGNYTVKNSYSGFCLAVKNGALSSGSTIDEVTCDGTTNQMWFQR